MGVSGTGKTTVGELLAERLGLRFLEGDSFHPESNIAKMTAGHPLDDDDRRPWLQKLNALLVSHDAEETPVVLTCSSLKRAYRDLLRAGVRDEVYFVHLVADRDVLAERMASREHFMPASMLDSQLDTLEPLESDETGREFDVSVPVEKVVDEVVAALDV